VPSLEALHGLADVVGVVCQPDKPSGRGLKLTAPAVKERAIALGLPVQQPTKLRTGEFGAWVRAQQADVAVVAAYGRILPGDVLSGPRLGCVNVHASLLPKYRGAAPIAWAIVRGEIETGITLMKLDEGLDTGPTFARLVTPIGPEEPAGELSARLAALGAEALIKWLPDYVEGRCVLVPQDGAKATLAPPMSKEDGRIDWSLSAARVHDHVRGVNPWPGAFTTARDHTLKVLATRALDVGSGKGEPDPLVFGTEPTPGRVLLADKMRVVVSCGRGLVELITVQPEGKRAMRAGEWQMGRGVAQGDVLGA
jgi:methionyl-tRNA formyltransferase